MFETDKGGIIGVVPLFRPLTVKFPMLSSPGEFGLPRSAVPRRRSARSGSLRFTPANAAESSMPPTVTLVMSPSENNWLFDHVSAHWTWSPARPSSPSDRHWRSNERSVVHVAADIQAGNLPGIDGDAVARSAGPSNDPPARNVPIAPAFTTAPASTFPTRSRRPCSSFTCAQAADDVH